jgi:hypothetical protein
MTNFDERVAGRNHPFEIVESIKSKYGANITFEFGKYIYLPQSVEEKRESFKVRADEINLTLINSYLDSLEPNQELALQSKVYSSATDFLHIPMIDFLCVEFGKYEAQTLTGILPNDIIKDFYLYDSGSSFHGYGVKLITEREWAQFMARLNLANFLNKKPIVDWRWVSHRLLAGYGSLRWSYNTAKHLRMPGLSGFFSDCLEGEITLQSSQPQYVEAICR